MERFNLNEKIEHVIEDVRSGLLSNGKTTKIIFERTENEIPVYGDRVWISQVISNLLNNALKFAKNGNIPSGPKICEQISDRHRAWAVHLKKHY